MAEQATDRPATEPPRNERGIDALLPDEIARKAEAVGAAKARLDFLSLLALAVLGGAFIGLGAMFSTTTLAGAGEGAPFGLVRLVAGLAFALGLILVIVGGAELFTGNTLMVMAWAGGKIRLAEMLRAWAIVYVGNFVGAVATALLVALAGQYLLGGGSVGAAALAIAETKAGESFAHALFLGILCNVLVCLAVWLSIGARTVTDKILAIMMPVAAFVAAGFEHSVANMYLLPLGLFIKAGASAEFWAGLGVEAGAYPALTWWRFAVGLVPVTVGNIIGGGVLVGAVYWFIYLRRRPR